MANKNTTKLDDLNLEDLNLDDFSMPSEGKPSKKDRKPITRIATGFVEGAKQQFTSKAFIKRTVTSALPRGYGTAINTADSVKQGVRELYNSAAQDLRPALPVIRKMTERAMPKAQKYLPKKVAAKLDAFIKAGKANGNYAADQDNETISGEIASIFKTQMEAQAEDTARSDTERRLRDDVTDKLNKRSASDTTNVRRGVDRLVAYQDQVTSRYQQKSLELQYRQYFTLRDMLKLQAENSIRDKGYLETLVKNTGLPDIVKTQRHEQYGAKLRDMIYGRSQQAVADYVTNFATRFKKNVSRSVQSTMGGVSAGLQGFGDLMDAQDMMKDFGGEGIDAYGAVGQAAGAPMADAMGRKFGRWARKHTTKHDGIRKFGAKLSYGLDNLPERASQFRRSSAGESGKMGFMMRWLKDMIPSMAQDQSLGESPLLTADHAAVFNNQTRRSITDIIPGFLSRIYQELQIIRTGDTSVKRTSFNLERGSFTEAGQVTADIKKRLFGKANMGNAHYGMKQMMREVDPDNALPPDVRKALQRQLLKDTMHGKSFDPARLAKEGSDTTELSAEHKKHITKHFRSRYKNTDGSFNYETASEGSRAMRSLQTYIPDPRAAMMAFIQTGNRESLDELGLITSANGRDNVNMDKVLDMMMEYDTQGGSDPAGGASSASPQGGRPGKMRRARGGRHARNGAAEIAQALANATGNHNVSGGGGSPFAVAGGPPTGAYDDLLKALRDADEHRVGESQHYLEALGTLAGIMAQHGGGSGESPTTAPGPGATGPGKFSRFGLFGRWGGKAVGGAMSGAGHFARGMGTYTSSVYSAMFKGAQHAAKVPGAILGTGLKYLTDIRVSGQWKPALYAAKIRAGEYVDAKTGKVIKSLSDIKGEVRDAAGNIALSAEDFAKGVFDTRGRQILKGVWKGVDAMGSFYGQAVQLPFKAVAAVMKGIGAALDFAKRPQDVYVKGEVGGDGKRHPRLTKVLMQAGMYFDKRTGKPIRRPKDIKGEVVDKDGNIVIGMDDLGEGKGLVNARGKPFRTLAVRIGTAVGGMVHMGAGLMGGYLKTVSSGMGMGLDFLSGTFKRLGGIFNPKLFGAFSTKSTGLLEDILKLLDTRLAVPKRIRKGSWQDQQANAKKHPDGTPIVAKAGAGGIEGGLIGWLQKFLDKDDEDDEDEDGNGSSYDHNSSDHDGKHSKEREKRGTRARDRAARKLRRKRRFGRSRIGRGLGAIKRFGGKGARFLGRNGSRAMNVMGLTKKGSILSKLKGFRPRGGGKLGIIAGLAGGLGMGAMADKLQGSTAGKVLDVASNASTALELGGMGAEAVGLGGLGSSVASGLGSAAAAIFSAPVLLTVGAVAAVGTAAYYGYKYYSLKKSQPLRKFRMAQYGLDINQGVWSMGKILDLEDKLKDHVQYGQNTASIDTSKLPMPELLQAVGLKKSSYNPLGWFHKENDQDAQNETAFIKWFQGRFKPVYLNWMSTVHGLDGQLALDDVDNKLAVDKKQKLLDAVNGIDASAFSVMSSPFGEDPLTASGDTISAAFKEAKAAIDAETKKGKDGKDSGGMGATVAKVAAAALLPGTAAAMAASALTKNQATTSAAKAANAATVKGIKGAAGVAIVSVALPKSVSLGRIITALSAARFKTYGLVSLTADRVKTLSILERDVFDKISVDANGIVVFKDSSEDYFTLYCGLFGIAPNNQVAKDKWQRWFNRRFIPTLLQFASAVKRANKTIDPLDADDRLKPNELLDVLNATIASTTPVTTGAVVSVWTLVESPWDDQPLNADSRTTEENANALKAAMAKQVVDEEKARSQTALEKATGASGTLTPKPSAPVKAVTNLGSFIDKVNSPQGLRSLGADAKAAAQSRGMIASSPSVPGSAGLPVPQPGKGTAGDVNAIPMPKGDGSWDAVKNTILAAAKMAGVDPALMATFASIESNFTANAKAGSSTATGLYQFVGGTWDDQLARYGAKYGIAPGTSRNDPRANALMGAEYLKENYSALQKSIGRAPTAAELYMAHFMGAGGAHHFLSASPDAIGETVNPTGASANPNIFYEYNGKKRVRPLTVAEITTKLNNLVGKKGGQDVSGMDTNTRLAANDSGKAPETGGVTTTTANGPKGGLGPAMGAMPKPVLVSGNGYAAATNKAANNTAYAALPVPAMDSSADLAVTASSRTDDSVVTKHRQTQAVQAAAADQRGQQINQSLNQQIGTIAGYMGRQVELLQQLVDTNVKSLAYLSGIHQNGQDVAASQPSTAVASASASARPVRGGGPQDVPSAPVSVQRNVRAG